MRLRSAAVGPDRVDAVLTFAAAEPLRTSQVAGLAERMLRLLPGLRAHRCENDAHATFGAELADTELAHLAEHVALELMAMAGSPDTLRGQTSWDFARDGAGVFHVSLEYDDDLVCLGALNLAERVVSWAISGSGDAPDVDAEARRLRGLRRRG